MYAMRPLNGAENRQPPSMAEAILPSCPAHAPVPVALTMYVSPSFGDAGGPERSRSRTVQHKSASISSRASLWVTCFWLCAAASSGSAERGVASVMLVLLLLVRRSVWV